MNLILLFSFCILISFSNGDLEGRISGGNQISINDHPYHVSIQHKNPSNVFAYTCGGALLRPNVVVTAAQCTLGSTPDKMRVHAGSSSHTGSGGETAAVARIIQHPDFVGFPLMTNDISMLILASAFNLKDSIKLVAMPYQGQNIQVGTRVNVTGWGSSFEGGPIQEFLKKITVPIVDQERCRNAYDGYVPITSNMLCAGVIGVGGEDFCQRDTGGPLVVNNILHGIISFGYSCGNPNYPGVYTRVSSYFNWINANIG